MLLPDAPLCCSTSLDERLCTWDFCGRQAYLRLQAQLLLQLQAEEEQDRRGEALYNLSGGSTPSNAPPTPGQPAACY